MLENVVLTLVEFEEFQKLSERSDQTHDSDHEYSNTEEYHRIQIFYSSSSGREL